MKTSISVPDNLWSQVAQPGSSPSQVVQQAIQAQLEQRAGASERLAGSEDVAGFLRHQLSEAAGVDELLEKLGNEAQHLRELGYAIGVDAAGKVPWKRLERLSSSTSLREELMREFDTGLAGPSGLPDDLAQAIWQSIADFEDPASLDDDGEPAPGPTLCSGIADGLADVCDAVRQRLTQGTDVSVAESPANEEAS